MAPHELTHFVSLFADRMPPHELTHWSEADRYEQMRLALAAADEEIRTLKISYDIRGSSILKLKANQQRLTSHLANQRECIRQLQETRREKDALIATIQARVAVLNVEIAEAGERGPSATTREGGSRLQSGTTVDFRLTSARPPPPHSPSVPTCSRKNLHHGVHLVQ